jgi:hypothetical protein
VGTVRGVNVIKETVLLETTESESYVEVQLEDIGSGKVDKLPAKAEKPPLKTEPAKEQPPENKPKRRNKRRKRQ